MPAWKRRQEELQTAVAATRAARDTAQAAAAQVSAELAGLEERRRGAEAGFSRIDRMFADGERRACAAHGAARRRVRRGRPAQPRKRNPSPRERPNFARYAKQPRRRSAPSGEEARALSYAPLADAEAQLKQLRGVTEAAREQRSARSTAAARLAAELAHLGEACVQDLGQEADALRTATAGNELPRLTVEALPTEEEACREMKRRLEAMGPGQYDGA